MLTKSLVYVLFNLQVIFAVAVENNAPLFPTKTNPTTVIDGHITNTTMSAPIQRPEALCFPRWAPRLLPDHMGCNTALSHLISEPNQQESRRWASPESGTLIVRQWQSTRCTFALMAKTASARDRFKLNEVSLAASYTMIRCVLSGPMKGGTLMVGNREVFEVVVAERIPALDLEYQSAGLKEARADGGI